MAADRYGRPGRAVELFEHSRRPWQSCHAMAHRQSTFPAVLRRDDAGDGGASAMSVLAREHRRARGTDGAYEGAIARVGAVRTPPRFRRELGRERSLAIGARDPRSSHTYR